jgi:hypothetical protein
MSEHESPYAAEDRAFALEILTRVEANTGLSFRGLFEQNLNSDEIRRRARGMILQYVQESAAAQVATAEWPLAGQPINAHEALFGASTVNVTPNIAVTEYNYKIIKGYRGNDVRDYVKRTTNGLSLLKDTMTAGEAAATILSSGIASFAIAMIVGTVKALIAKQTLRAAVVAGVRAMGTMKVVVGVAAVIIVELLIYLMVHNEKVFLGMVFNNTPLSLVVRDWRQGVDGANNGDLFMNTGSMTTFMETHMDEKLDSPLVQVLEKFDVGDPADNIISGGIFCAQKNFGFFGTEGALVLSKYSKDPDPTLPRFALLFACPYTLDNGVNVQVDTAGAIISAKSYFDKLYSSRGQYKEYKGTGYTFAASCADPRGGEAAGIATLDVT